MRHIMWWLFGRCMHRNVEEINEVFGYTYRCKDCCCFLMEYWISRRALRECRQRRGVKL